MPCARNVSTVYASYFNTAPSYKLFADEAARTVEVPDVNNSIAIWQAFRDSYSSSVIFAKTPRGLVAEQCRRQDHYPRQPALIGATDMSTATVTPVDHPGPTGPVSASAPGG